MNEKGGRINDENLRNESVKLNFQERLDGATVL